MKNKYITTKNGFKMVVRAVVVNDFLVEICESYDRKKTHLLEEERYEELIELEKLKHFDFRECLTFWDNFDFELYLEVLKAKNNISMKK